MTIERIPTGIIGLDEILLGGLVANRAYLIKGQPGSGKTTLGFHFLSAGMSSGERTLFISFSESKTRLRRNAQLMNIDLTGIEFLDLTPTADFFTKDQRYDIFSPSEVERAPITAKLIEKIKAVKPQRIFLDAITQFRYMAMDKFEFRQQIQSFLRFVTDSNDNTTLLFTSEGSEHNPDDDLQFMSDGIITLRSAINRRSIEVNKFRGSNFAKGRHDLQLGDRGMAVYPILIPETHHRQTDFEAISAGIPEIDELLYGGIERGTVTIFCGPSGVGKSSLGMQFMKEAAGRGERSVLYAFEEAENTIVERCESINIPVRAMTERGTLSLMNIEPLKYTPNQFAHLVRSEVEQNNAKIVMIDSTSGYKLSMEGEDLIRQLHSLCQYLKNMGVTVILIDETHVIAGGEFSVTEVGLSYIADNLVFLRYLEVGGELRKAIGVLKKRVSDFERTLREFQITKYGIKVGEPLSQLRGILSGIPDLINSEQQKKDLK